MPRLSAVGIALLQVGEDVNLNAKLGRERKGAQEDVCAVFAAALFDVLSAEGIPCQLATVQPRGLGANWAHAVVQAEGRYYDSMGEFSANIYRARARIHPSVAFELDFRPDTRCDCYEPEFDDLHAFFVSALNKALRGPIAVQKGADRAAPKHFGYPDFPVDRSS